jgi:hypothetical protein
VKEEAAKGVLYRRLTLRAVQLSSEVYCTPAVEEKDCNVMYSIDGVHLTFNIRTASNL